MVTVRDSSGRIVKPDSSGRYNVTPNVPSPPKPSPPPTSSAPKSTKIILDPKLGYSETKLLSDVKQVLDKSPRGTVVTSKTYTQTDTTPGSPTYGQQVGVHEVSSVNQQKIGASLVQSPSNSLLDQAQKYRSDIITTNAGYELMKQEIRGKPESQNLRKGGIKDILFNKERFTTLAPPGSYLGIRQQLGKDIQLKQLAAERERDLSFKRTVDVKKQILDRDLKRATSDEQRQILIDRYNSELDKVAQKYQSYYEKASLDKTQRERYALQSLKAVEATAAFTLGTAAAVAIAPVAAAPISIGAGAVAIGGLSLGGLSEYQKYQKLKSLSPNLAKREVLLDISSMSVGSTIGGAAGSIIGGKMMNLGREIKLKTPVKQDITVKKISEGDTLDTYLAKVKTRAKYDITQTGLIGPPVKRTTTRITTETGIFKASKGFSDQIKLEIGPQEAMRVGFFGEMAGKGIKGKGEIKGAVTGNLFYRESGTKMPGSAAFIGSSKTPDTIAMSGFQLTKISEGKYTGVSVTKSGQSIGIANLKVIPGIESSLNVPYIPGERYVTKAKISVETPSEGGIALIGKNLQNLFSSKRGALSLNPLEVQRPSVKTTKLTPEGAAGAISIGSFSGLRAYPSSFTQTYPLVSTGLSQRFNTISKQKLEFSQERELKTQQTSTFKFDVGAVSESKVAVVPKVVPRTIQTPEQRFDLITPQPPPTPKPIPPVPVTPTGIPVPFGFQLPQGGGRNEERRYRGRKKKRTFKYTASLIGLESGKVLRRKPRQQSFTGFEVRLPERGSSKRMRRIKNSFY